MTRFNTFARRNFIKSLGASILVVASAIAFPKRLQGAPESVRQRIDQVVATAGGEEKLLKLFRFRERILVTAAPAPPVTPEEKGNRTSVVQVGGEW